jgi:hypothetical protein
MLGCSVSLTTKSFCSVVNRRRRATPVMTSTFENVSDGRFDDPDRGRSLGMAALRQQRPFHKRSFGETARDFARERLACTNSHSRFYANPRLRARVLPARSEMLTTLIARMSDLLAPISKSTTRT